MKSTRALIIGAGSIGQRHQQVLAGMGCSTAFQTSRRDIQELCFANFRSSLEDFNPNYVVIATPTSQHLESLNSLTEAGYNGKLLIEKPAALEGLKTETLALKDVRVAYNLRFHPVFKTLKNIISEAKILSVDVHAGQALATWRPDRETSSTYSSHKSLGGGVLRDLSHELDYLTLLLGKWENVVSLGGRIGEVTIDSDDSWSIIATTTRTTQLSLQLNYFDRPGTRTITVNTSTDTIRADLISNELTVSGVTTQFNLDRNTTYFEMHNDFLNQEDSQLATLDEANEIDNLIKDIEHSSLLREWVTR